MRDRNNSRGGDRGQKRSFDSFSAVCDSCGKDCQVPFKPTQGKPVYCNDCFKKHAPPRDDRRGSRDSRGPRRDDRSGGGGRSFAKPDTKVYDELVKLNQKFDNLITLLEPKAKKATKKTSKSKSSKTKEE